MRATHGRLNRLNERLTAKERAKLVLRSLKEDEDEDPWVRRMMPASQINEFNRLITLMNGVNIRLGALVAILHQSLLVVSQRLGWLCTLVLFEASVDGMEQYLRAHVKRPLTESEYAEHKRRAENELIPVEALAEEEADENEDWRPEDIESGDDGEEFVSEAAWDRVKKERMKALRRLVKEGALEGRRTRKGLSIRAGSYYGRRGVEVPVYLDGHREIEVIPDSRREEVQRWRRSLERLRKSMRPFSEGGPPASEDGDGRERLRDVLGEKIKSEIEHLSLNLGALEPVIEEVAEEFDGDDPCRPAIRELLEDTRAGLKRQLDLACQLMGPIALPEPGEETIEAMRERVRRPIIDE